MQPRWALMAAVALVLLAMPARRAVANDAEPELRSAVGKARAAMLAKDGNLVRAAMATSTYHDMRNMIAATGQVYAPAMLEMAAMAMPDVADARTLLTRVKGPTALWIARAGNDTIAAVLLRENDAWRFARIHVYSKLERDDEATLLEKLPAEYQPTGELPAVTPLLPEPEVLGQYSIQHAGLIGTARFHDHFTHALKPVSAGQPTGSSGVIVGGLKRGRNVITITGEAENQGTPLRCEVTIKTFEAGKLAQTTTVYEGNVSDRLPGTATIEFTIP